MIARIRHLLTVLRRRLNHGRVVQATIRGVRYELDLSEMIDQALYEVGVYEEATTRLLERVLEPHMVVLEVGANVGAHTFDMARVLQAGGGMVHAFEPTSWAFAKLERNRDLNSFDNVVLHRLALSDGDGEEVIRCASSEETLPFRASWDVRRGGTKNQAEDRILFERLDGWVARHEVERIDLIKMDVDGYELKVIRGGLQALRRMRPLMVVEFGVTLERVGDSVEELWDTLFDLRYAVVDAADGVTPYARDELLAAVRAKRTLDCLCRPVSS